MAGAEPPDFSAIIMLCDSVACPEGKLYIQGGGWQTLPSGLGDDFPADRGEPVGNGVTGCPFTSPAVRVYW